MTQYPIFFKITHDVRGETFTARVLTNGRALMEFEDDAWWCYGVNPGGMAADGSSPAEAFSHFRVDLGEIFSDMATQSKTCDEFKRMVQEFVAQEPPKTANEWEAARARIRAGETPSDQTIANLKRVTDTPQIGVVIGAIEEFLPQVDELKQAA